MPARGPLCFKTPRLALAAVMVAATAWMAPAPDAGAITIREDIDLRRINRAANTSRYHGVGRIDNDAPRKSQSLAGTGTLIAPQWVLTAGHVVDGTNAKTWSTRFGSREIAGWAAPAGYGSGFGTDLALVKLTEPVTDIAPATLRSESARFSEFNQRAIIIGTGKSGFGDTGVQRTKQHNRLAINRVDGIVGDNILITDFDSPFTNTSQSGDAQATRLEGGLVAGDSGGPMFIREGSAWTLAAVAVYASTADPAGLSGKYGEINGFVRLKNYLPWINSVISGSVNPTLRSTSGGGIVRPGGLPEPATAAVVLAGLGLLAQRRR
ncbi:MAG: trypsin-like serine protease [Planctomycetota bacterium]